MYLNEAQTEAMVHERYRDSEGLLQHVANLGELVGAMMEVASITGEILGTPSPALKKMLDGAGVRVFLPHRSMSCATRGAIARHM